MDAKVHLFLLKMGDPNEKGTIMQVFMHQMPDS